MRAKRSVEGSSLGSIAGRGPTAALVGGLALSLAALGCRPRPAETPRDGESANAAAPAPIAETLALDGDAARVGAWSAPETWRPAEAEGGKFVAVHAHLAPTGEVLVWSHDGDDVAHHGLTSGVTHNAFLWNWTTGAFTHVPHPDTNIFCSGHTWMADGRLLVIGGHGGYPATTKKNAIRWPIGLPAASVFDPVAHVWTDLPPTAGGRWYPTLLPLASGETLVVGGWDRDGRTNPLPQVLTAQGTWRSLTKARTAAYNDFYPYLHQAADGRVIAVGPAKQEFILTTTGTGKIAAGPRSLWGRRYYGASAMYADGKVLLVGGNRNDAGTPSDITATAEVIDLNAPKLAFRAVAPMQFPRWYLNATVLPDGTVLVTGGTGHQSRAGQATALSGAVYAAELFHPATETWETLASMRVPRMYHGTAVLLPDGRVLAAGSGLPLLTGEAVGADHEEREMFSPPYLFKGPRPEVAPLGATVRVGATLTTTVTSATPVTRVTMLRLPSVTHDLNMGERFLELPVTLDGTTLSATLPSAATRVPPGPYLVFALSAAGVPSIGQIVRVTL